jgi:hypothetical protein
MKCPFCLEKGRIRRFLTRKPDLWKTNCCNIYAHYSCQVAWGNTCIICHNQLKVVSTTKYRFVPDYPDLPQAELEQARRLEQQFFSRPPPLNTEEEIDDTYHALSPRTEVVPDDAPLPPNLLLDQQYEYDEELSENIRTLRSEILPLIINQRRQDRLDELYDNRYNSPEDFEDYIFSTQDEGYTLARECIGVGDFGLALEVRNPPSDADAIQLIRRVYDAVNSQ